MSPEGETLVKKLRAWITQFELERVTEIDLYDRVAEEIDAYMDGRVIATEAQGEGQGKSSS